MINASIFVLCVKHSFGYSGSFVGKLIMGERIGRIAQNDLKWMRKDNKSKKSCLWTCLFWTFHMNRIIQYSDFVD